MEVGVLRAAMLAEGLVTDTHFDAFVRSMGDEKMVDVCVCYFQSDGVWLVVYARQVFGLTRFYYDCDCEVHNPCKPRTHTEATIAIADRLVSRLREVSELAWEKAKQ